MRKENAIRNFEVEIKLLKNKSLKSDARFRSIDEEIEQILNSTFEAENCDNMKKLWIEDCEREEKKSAEIWIKKQRWLESYELTYGTKSPIQNENFQKVTYRRRKMQNQQHTQASVAHQSNQSNQSHSMRENTNRKYQKNSSRPNSNNSINGNRQNMAFHKGTTYIGKNVKKHFLEKGRNDKGGGTTPSNHPDRLNQTRQFSNSEETRLKVVATQPYPETEETTLKTVQ